MTKKELKRILTFDRESWPDEAHEAFLAAHPPEQRAYWEEVLRPTRIGGGIDPSGWSPDDYMAFLRARTRNLDD